MLKYLTLLVGAICSTVASAQIYSAAADFSATDNPNGQWQYGFVTSLSLPFTRYTNNDQRFFGTETWSRGLGTANAEPPAVFFNSSDSTINVATGTLLSGELGLHPGNDGLFSVVRWTSARSDYYWIDAAFLRRDVGTTFVHISYSNQDCGFCTTYASLFGAALGANAVSGNYLQQVFVPAGASINFAVGYGEDQSSQGDTTALFATISDTPPVPEPSTALSLFFGILSLVALRRRTRSDA